jgi:hypothetical protein
MILIVVSKIILFVLINMHYNNVNTSQASTIIHILQRQKLCLSNWKKFKIFINFLSARLLFYLCRYKILIIFVWFFI